MLISGGQFILGTTYLNGRHLHRDDVELLLLGVTTFATRLPCCVFAVDPNRSSARKEDGHTIEIPSIRARGHLSNTVIRLFSSLFEAL
jgi:hypothetical protein